MISKHFLTADLPVSATILKDEWTWLETAGRMQFLAATWLFAALAFLVFVVVIRDLMEPTHKHTRIAAGVVLITIFGLAIMPSYRFWQDPDALRNYHQLGGDLFEAALGRGTLPGCVGAGDRWLLGACGDFPVIALLNRMIDVINIFAGLGVGGLVVGMILCLEKPVGGDINLRAAQLELSVLRMRRQLYLSGLILTIGIFFAASWMRWPLPMVDSAHLDAYSSVIGSALLYTGVYFSLLILSFYLPVAMILERCKRDLAVAATDHGNLSDYKTREDWLKLRGLQTDPTEYLKSGIALVAPILAAYAGSFPTLF